ncbi:predicted protein [Sclerotinia sclerotiorum 1980 UF-70]|uniref:Uncharacterized protein n=1 Tax=Sclerotinia sclerotiorum (strain ATCC 18683 / 1980 / Ss-1) TaxID=665079 RepID=A7F966_SCLS1|nr:predicted protein [Sclerotinia sclerotiorum 1980 UF-70]EDO00277.1 predicted protein [Sclerotinia sclerotiorum 1980 UF-70]
MPTTAQGRNSYKWARTSSKLLQKSGRAIFALLGKLRGLKDQIQQIRHLRDKTFIWLSCQDLPEEC